MGINALWVCNCPSLRAAARVPLGYWATLVLGTSCAMVSPVTIAANLSPLDDQNASANGMLTLADAGAPTGRLLLIRQGSDRCAVRFTDFARGRDAKPATVLDSGAESFSAQYDWFYPRRDTTGAVSYETGHRKVSSKALVGIGRLAFQLENDVVRCGPFKLLWAYPTRVGFFPSDAMDADVGIELAPTKARSIEEVNFDDAAIRWYRTDQSRKPMLIPLSELP